MTTAWSVIGHGIPAPKDRRFTVKLPSNWGATQFICEIAAHFNYKLRCFTVKSSGVLQ